MEMSEFFNNVDSRSAISKIITWVEEPKSADVRTAAKCVIVSMFNLNPPEFSAITSGLQKTFQVGCDTLPIYSVIHLSHTSHFNLSHSQEITHRVISSHLQGLTDTLDSPVNPLHQMGTRTKPHSPNPRASPRYSINPSVSHPRCSDVESIYILVFFVSLQ